MDGSGIDKSKGGSLFETVDATIIPGDMPEFQFWLLIEISPIHSEKMIFALKEFLVQGYSRKDICKKYGISSGYFSSALGRFQRVIFTVIQLMPYYIKKNEGISE